MDDTEFDAALVASAFQLAAERGWNGMSVAQAARDAGLPLNRARRRFPNRAAVLMRFGSLADQEALRSASTLGTQRDRLFDLLMRRFDTLQRHRAGVLAVMRYLPCDPALALLLQLSTLRSMGWMLDAAGISAHGLRGQIRRQGMIAVWLYALNAWRNDQSEDLAGTMSALDNALSRAERAASWLDFRGRGDATPREAAAEAPTSVTPVPDSDMPPPPMTPEPPASPPV